MHNNVCMIYRTEKQRQFHDNECFYDAAVAVLMYADIFTLCVEAPRIFL